MARKKREDELAALRAENARLKALLEQWEAAPQERLPQPAPAEAEVAPAPDTPNRPRQPRRKQVQDRGPSPLTCAVITLMVIGYTLVLPIVLIGGFDADWAPPWNWLLGALIVFAFCVFPWLKARENRRKREHLAQVQQQEQERLARAQEKALERLERLKQKEQARIARLQERERAKAAQAAAPKPPRARARITRPLRAPTTQKLEPEE